MHENNAFWVCFSKRFLRFYWMATPWFVMRRWNGSRLVNKRGGLGLARSQNAAITMKTGTTAPYLETLPVNFSKLGSYSPHIVIMFCIWRSFFVVYISFVQDFFLGQILNLCFCRWPMSSWTVWQHWHPAVWRLWIWFLSEWRKQTFLLSLPWWRNNKWWN